MCVPVTYDDPVPQAISLLVVMDHVVPAGDDAGFPEAGDDVPPQGLDAAGDRAHAASGPNRSDQFLARHADELAAAVLFAELLQDRHALAGSAIADDRDTHQFDVAGVKTSRPPAKVRELAGRRSALEAGDFGVRSVSTFRITLARVRPLFENGLAMNSEAPLACSSVVKSRQSERWAVITMTGMSARAFDPLDVLEQVAAKILVGTAAVRLGRDLQVEQDVAVLAFLEQLLGVVLVGRPVVVVSDREQRVFDRVDNPVVVFDDQRLWFHGSNP